MKEQEVKFPTNQEKGNIDKTIAFVQRAFADDVIGRIDEAKKHESIKKKYNWERDKWVLLRYISEEHMTFDGLTHYHGDWHNGASVRNAYVNALTTIWEASPIELQQKYPKEEIIKGKNSPKRQPQNRIVYSPKKETLEEYKKRYDEAHAQGNPEKTERLRKYNTEYVRQWRKARKEQHESA